jgi:hypothetical protein
VAIIAIPDALSRITAREESRVFDLMDRLAVAQQRFRRDRARDEDHDDRGEYGFLADLAVPGPDGRPWLDLTTAEPSGDYWRVGTYRLAVLLPNADGIPVLPSSGNTVDPRASAVAFLAVAWPEHVGHSALRAYAVNQNLIVREYRNDDGEISGSALPDFPALTLLEPNARRFILTKFWPAGWETVLPELQLDHRRAALERLSLPVPVVLQQGD